MVVREGAIDILAGVMAGAHDITGYLMHLRLQTRGMSRHQFAKAMRAAPTWDAHHVSRPSIRTLESRLQALIGAESRSDAPCAADVLSRLPRIPHFAEDASQTAAAEAIRIWFAEELARARNRSRNDPSVVWTWRKAFAAKGWARPEHDGHLHTPLRRFFLNLQRCTQRYYGHPVEERQDRLMQEWILWPSGKGPGTRSPRLARHLRDACRLADRGQARTMAEDLLRDTAKMPLSEATSLWVPRGAEILNPIMAPMRREELAERFRSARFFAALLEEAYLAAELSHRLLGLLLWLRRWHRRERGRPTWILSGRALSQQSIADADIDRNLRDAMRWHDALLQGRDGRHPLEGTLDDDSWP